jgi:hypothetical protein
MPGQSISAVLPLKIYGRHYLENLARTDILFTSLSRYAEPGLLKEIFVVVPARERREIMRSLEYWRSLPLQVINEDDILPVFRTYPRASGWVRQQLVKLYAANLSSSEYFVTLDPDVILCKRAAFSDVVVGGKAILQPEARGVHAAWWTGSARLLGVPEDLDRPGMFVTPAILSRSICKMLFDDLQARYRRDWSVVLLQSAKLKWTEYTLYYLTGERHGAIEQFHVIPSGPPQAHLICASHVWDQGDFACWDVEACFCPRDPGLFTIVQSAARVPAAEIRRVVQPYFRVERESSPRAVLKLRSLGEDVVRKTLGFV